MIDPNARLIEQLQIVSGFAPVSLTSAQNGDYVSLKNYEGCLVVFFKGIGTAGQDPTISLRQAQDVADTGGKVLNFTRIESKQGTLTAVGQFTSVSQAAAATYTHTDAAEAEAIWAIDVRREDLDHKNGFDCLRASIADVGTNSQLGCVLYLLYGARHINGALPSAIAD